MLTVEQFLERRTGIGGSDASAVCGLSKYATPLDIYLDKTTERVKEETEAMRRGRILEPFVRSLYEHETGYRVHEVPTTHRHPDHPFMLAHLDGLLPSERALVELKTADYRTKIHWGAEGSDEIPQEYLIQCSHYAAVMDIDTVHVGVLFGDEKLFKAFIALHRALDLLGESQPDFEELEVDFRIYTYTRNRTLESRLITKEKSFWFDHVEKRIPPKPQVDDVEDLLKAYPVGEDKTIQVDEEALQKIQALAEIKAKKKALEETENTVKASVMSLFGNASSLVDSSNRLLATWKNKARTVFDKDRLAQDHPDLMKTFTKTMTTRELRVM